MDAMKSQSATSAPKRRWFQFSLRSLMLFMVCCSIACSWYATRVANQREAVRAILGMEDCSVAYDCDNSLFDLAPVVAALSGQPPPPARRETLAERLLGKDFVYNVVEAEIPIDKVNNAVPQLARLSHLKKVSIVLEKHVSDDVIDAATEITDRHLPGVEVVISHLETSWDVEHKSPQTADAHIGDSVRICWTHDTTEAVADAATWIGILIAL